MINVVRAHCSCRFAFQSLELSSEFCIVSSKFLDSPVQKKSVMPVTVISEEPVI